MGFIKKLIRALSNKKYRKNPNASFLTREQHIALNVGAINAEQTMYFCDSLETGADTNDTKQNLANYYDIIDRESAICRLEWLLSRGHHVYFEAIKGFVSVSSTCIDDTELLEHEKAQLDEYVNNINETMQELIENSYIISKEDLADRSVVAWDMGRLVLVSRCCYELGYISKSEVWKYIEDAYKQCKEVYQDWKAVANGYIIGRCMWSGSSMMISGLMDIASDLLVDSDSPWVKYPLI